MAKYHDSGTVCKASKRSCPLGLTDSDHIEADNWEQFQEKLAIRMDKAGKSFESVSKKKDSTPLKESAEVETYIHPNGSKITISEDGEVKAFRRGKETTTAITAEKLRKGYGAWKRAADSESKKFNTSPKTEENRAGGRIKFAGDYDNLPNEHKKLLDDYADAEKEVKDRQKEFEDYTANMEAYDKVHAAEEGRAYYYHPETYRRIEGFNPDGETIIDPTDEQSEEYDKLWNQITEPLIKMSKTQTKAEEAGLGHHIPDDGKTIRVKNMAQKWIFIEEIQGQISGGHWGKTKNSRNADIARAKVIVDPKNTGRNFKTKRDNFAFDSPKLIRSVGDRMLSNVRKKTSNNSYRDDNLLTDLRGLRGIVQKERDSINSD